MNENTTDPAAKKVKYIASIIYLLVLAFIVGGSYLNQQQGISADIDTNETIIWSDAN
ncbi:MAG: hypothetical protein ACKE51_07720 [Methylococcaceae bacterium]